MHEVSRRWTLTVTVIAAVEGVVALVLGAFVAPIPARTDATQLATALFIRGFLALLALAAAFALAYFAGYRIEGTLGPSNADPKPAVASSPLVSLFVTPGPRRDALYAGALTLAAYWFFTTLYIAALGRTVGSVGVTSGAMGSFIFSRVIEGLALAAAGAGAGGLGARNMATRHITQRIFTGAGATSVAPMPTQPIIPPAAPEATAPSDAPQRGEGE
jgi:hypothetical protein